MLRVSWLITIVSPYLVARFALRNLEVRKTLIKQNQAGDQMEMRVQRPLSKNVVQLGTLGHRRPVCRWSNCLGVGGGGVAQAAWTRRRGLWWRGAATPTSPSSPGSALPNRPGTHTFRQ